MRKVGQGTISIRSIRDWKGWQKIQIPIGAIYLILKPFGRESTNGFAITGTRGDQNYDWRGRNIRGNRSWRRWGILKYGSIRSVTRAWRRRRMERFLQTKGRMGGFIRGMNVVLTLNETTLLFPFRGIETLIIKYGTIPRSQLDLLGKKVKGNVIP